MGTIFLICLFLATHLHADNISNSSATSVSTSKTAAPVDSTRLDVTTTPSASFDMDEELAKIAASCLTREDHEQLSGNLFRYLSAVMFNYHLVEEAEEMIGLTEMRAVLGFAPPGPWKHFSYRKPSAEELAAAITVEEYFDLKEPRSEDRSLDSIFFFEKNFTPAIAFLDERFPGIRMIFRRRFEEILSLDLGGRIDRKTVDHMIDEFIENILPKVDSAIKKMYRGKECWRHRRLLQV